jgi:hypothetical protein
VRRLLRVAVSGALLVGGAMTCGGRVASVPSEGAGAPDAGVSEAADAAEVDRSEREAAAVDVVADAVCPACPVHASCNLENGPTCYCDPGYTACGHDCFDTTSDPQHCGSCAACPPGDVCDRGLCVPPFACGNLTCSNADEQYCMIVWPGCEPFGSTCTTSADCCTLECVGGVCGGPDASPGGGGPTYACAAVPPECRTSPPTCACILADQPCGPGTTFGATCTQSAGVVSVTCTGE